LGAGAAAAQIAGPHQLSAAVALPMTLLRPLLQLLAAL